MKPSLFFIFSLFLFNHSFAQLHQDAKRDNFWVLGYDSNPNFPEFGGTDIDFNNCEFKVSYKFRDMNFDNTNASICDENGELLFYTNGIFVADATHAQMENGDNLNPGIWTTEFASEGLIVPQGVLIFPYPEKPEEYILIHGLLNLTDIGRFHYSNLYYSIIDMSLNGGLGKVTEKNIEIIDDTLDFGKLTATRHANGRDWWMIIPKDISNEYYTLLINNEGVQNLGTQTVGTSVVNGVGQAVFSPNGEKYARNDLSGAGPVWVGLNVYDFDRCTGLLSNQEEIFYVDSVYRAGLAISPNSRYLYALNQIFALQFDLEAPDLASSVDTIAVYDGFMSPPPLLTTFFLAQTGPDNKIYVGTSTSNDVMHVIHNPNKKGVACDFEQHSIKLPTFNVRSIPNFPNYRLGPLDGSPCDTLGLDNLPLAGFRYEKDSLDSLHFQFRSLSFFEPETWHWDFGDGDTSNEVDPIHTFEEKENYEVCLTVSNEYGEDTFCKILELNPTSVKDTENNFFNLRIYPNPASDFLRIKTESEDRGSADFELFNALGQRVLSEKTEGSKEHKISLWGIKSGVYFYQISEQGILRKSGKIIVQK